MLSDRINVYLALAAATLVLFSCAMPMREAPLVEKAPPEQTVAMNADASKNQYPVLLTSVAEQENFGLLISSHGPCLRQACRKFSNTCYYYGDGGNMISISDDFLAGYVRQGFTLQTFCLGAASSIRYHPETGERLATLITGDELSYGEGSYVEASEEVTIQIPSCFRRGLPYSDCHFSYDPITGQRLSQADTAIYAERGKSLLEAMRTALDAGYYSRPCSEEEASKPKPGMSLNCYVERSSVGLERDLFYDEDLSVFGINYPDLSFIDVSPTLPEGFGYALYASGDAGPVPPDADIEIAIKEKKRATEARIENLKIIAAGKATK